MSASSCSVKTVFLCLSLAVAVCAAEDDAIMEEIADARESAVVAVGMTDVLSEAAAVMVFLEAQYDYTAEFCEFADYAVDLAMKFLDERIYDLEDPLMSVLRRFMKWLYPLELSGHRVLDLRLNAYVDRGEDPPTEELRVVVSLMNSRCPEIPDDPFGGYELSVLSQLFAQHLHQLVVVSRTPK